MKKSNENTKKYFQPAFLICVTILVVAGAGMSIAIKSLGLYLKKEPLPLKKSLDLLDENGLSGYIIEPHNKHKIENQEIIKELGTEDYIQWIIEDSNAPDYSAARKCFLFITYYATPDKVPHVPEECYAGGGFQRISSTGITLNIDKESKNKIQAQYLTFSNKNSDIGIKPGEFPILYFFRVNGEYAGSRERARRILNKNLFHKSSYFSKVELAFNQFTTAPDKEETIKACESLLTVILPILEAEHWPDWQDTKKY